MSSKRSSVLIVPSRVAVTDSKLAKPKRKCTIDTTLPQVSTKTFEPSAPLLHDTEKVQDAKTPETNEVLRKTSASTSHKRKLQQDFDFTETKRFKESQDGGLRDNGLQPMYNNFQLLGDSQFVRFAEQLLMLRASYIGSVRRIGYCVSGQKIEDLRCRLREKELELHTNVIVLIGTNDFIQRTDFRLMCASYVRLISFLKENCSNIILLTVPPVPKFERNGWHWEVLQHFNQFILKHAQDEQIGVIDLCSVFISYRNTVSRDYFEKVYWNTARVDLIHLNEKGFKVLRFLLDLHIFENRKRLNNETTRRQLF